MAAGNHMESLTKVSCVSVDLIAHNPRIHPAPLPPWATIFAPLGAMEASRGHCDTWKRKGYDFKGVIVAVNQAGRVNRSRHNLDLGQPV